LKNNTLCKKDELRRRKKEPHPVKKEYPPAYAKLHIQGD
jgi:hypothetical protein